MRTVRKNADVKINLSSLEINKDVLGLAQKQKDVSVHKI